MISGTKAPRWLQSHPHSSLAPSRAAVLLAAALAVASFALEYHVARILDRHQAFDEINLLFDADANWFLTSFSEGWGQGHSWAGRGFVHPNVANVVNPPVRLAARVVGLLGDRGDRPHLRRQFSILVAPLASAVKTAFVFLTVLALGLSSWAAVMIAVLSAVSGSSLLFGSIPESYALTGAALSLLLYLAATFLRRGNRFTLMPWVLVAAALFSITVTNLVPAVLTVALLLYRRTKQLWESLLAAARVGALAIAVSVVLLVAMTTYYRAWSNFRPVRPGQFEEVRLQPARTAVEFPRALGLTIVPSSPRVIEASLKERDRVLLTFRGSATEWGGLLLVLTCLGFSIFASAGAAAESRLFTELLLAVLAFNWVLHSFYGHEFFLYSQHWQVPLVLLLSSALAAPRQWRVVGWTLITVLLATTIYHDVRFLDAIVTALKLHAGVI